MKAPHVAGKQPFKRSIVIAGQKTSISLEHEFWDAVAEIAAQEKLTRSQLVSRIKGARPGNNLSSAIRVFVLQYYRSLTEGKRNSPD